jgi:hypothetical protein
MWLTRRASELRYEALDPVLDERSRRRLVAAEARGWTRRRIGSVAYHRAGAEHH